MRGLIGLAFVACIVGSVLWSSHKEGAKTNSTEAGVGSKELATNIVPAMQPTSSPKAPGSGAGQVEETAAPTPSNDELVAALQERIEGLKSVTVPNEAKDAVVPLLVFYADAAALYEAKERKNTQVTKAALTLEKQLKRTQLEMFPKFRKAWAASMDRQMWEHNISVRAFGKGNRSVKIVGGVFASNAAIKATQETLHDNLVALRFSRVEYRWYRQADEYTYYKLDSLADDVLASHP